jgi:hypothetical protein
MSNEIDSLRKLTDLLHQDYAFVGKKLDSDHNGFWSRTFIKTAVSLIEAELFIFKQEILSYCKENQVRLDPEVSLFLNNKKYEISSNGQVKERLLQVRLKDDLRFTYSQIFSIKGHELCIGYEDGGWSKVIETIAVRNRLTHPKSIADITVSKQEEDDCKLAIKWFVSNMVNFYDQEMNDIKKRTKKKAEDLQRMKDKIIKQASKGT